MNSIKLGSSLLLAASVVFGIGCGSVGGTSGDDDDVGGDFTLGATPTSVSVPIASTGTVTVSIDRVGAGGDVMLTAQNLPAGITASFASNPVPATSNSCDVTFAVAPGTSPGTSNVTIVGRGAGLEKTVTIAVTASTITVAGTIRGGRSGVMVHLVGKTAAVSATDGTFTFTDVSPPYDLYTIGNSGTVLGTPVPTVFYFKGLTRPDPVVSAPATSVLIAVRRQFAPVTGTTTSAPNVMVVAWETGGSVRVNQTNAYSLTASWPSTVSGTFTGALFGFQFSTDPVTGAPSAFTGYASQAGVQLSSTVDASVNLVMQAPTTAALTGTITSPSGFPRPDITLTQQTGAASGVELWSAPGTTTTANATIPLVAAGKASLFATATLDAAVTQYVHPALAAATDVTFALPPPAVQTAPLNAATGVTTTTAFTWSSAPETLYEVDITTPPGATATARYVVYTTAASTTIPAVTELPVPVNQMFSWHVNGYGPNTTINNVASKTGLESVVRADFEGDRHWFTNSTDRTFTSAP